MKRYLFPLLLSGLLPCSGWAQLANGSVSAFFGVDGDTRSNYVKYGPATGAILSDDWFSSSTAGKNVIDTTNASFYTSLLQADNNFTFSQRMSVPLYSKINGRLWLDAAYGRDYLATNPLFDSTAFTTASKNGDNPSAWAGGITNIPDKNDLVDVYAHMRRDGITVKDSLWLFTGVATVGTSGSRYFDIELYKNSFSYNRSTGAFSTAGPDAGHTQWLFDASGNIVQTGDLILAVNYTPGAPPVVDVRIWVSQSTFSTVVPAYFNFGTAFDGATPSFGYASILSKSGATSFGSGIANYSAAATQDTTSATPWGTEQATKNWGTQYQSLQLVEIGLNLTRIGVDPALYTAQGLSACQSLFSNIFFKSRSSNSFSSNMQDFMVPLDFLRMPVMDYTLQPDTLRCNRIAGMLQIVNHTTSGYYSWQTTAGSVSGANADSSVINITKAGTYILSASPAQGCPATRRDTVIVPIDTFPPVASVIAALAGSRFQLLGGDLAASNYPTPFGGSQGLLWDWSGPGGFTSTIQNPTADTVWGTYQLIVTEIRNGCKDTAMQSLDRSGFMILSKQSIVLTGTTAGMSITLRWEDKNAEAASWHEIEKLIGGRFVSIGKASGSGSTFTDNTLLNGDNTYRVKLTKSNGVALYSNTVSVNALAPGWSAFKLSGNILHILSTRDQAGDGTVCIYNMAGQVLSRQVVKLSSGLNTLDLPMNAGSRNTFVVAVLYLSGQPAVAQKLLW